jgi:glycine hydroxymethyltransferase
VGIIANKNAIPFDPRPPRVASGLRLGTPAVTSRGFKEKEIKQVARMIVQVLAAPDDEALKRRVSTEVKELASSYPVPGLDS